MAGENRRIKRYEELTFADDFMFCKILQSHPELCKELAEMILGKKLGEIIRISKQHVIEITSDGRGVRFDVYLEDDRNTICDIEMQTRMFPGIPKRARYYQSMIDLESLERAEDYGKLPQSYVIFISLKNPFPNIGLHKYSFASICRERTELELGDGRENIFLSAEGTESDISDELKSFLVYLMDQQTDSEFTGKLEAAVENAKKRKQWGTEYMTLYEMRKMDREEGREEGQEETARRMIRMNKFTDEDIAEATGLTAARVKEIREAEKNR